MSKDISSLLSIVRGNLAAEDDREAAALDAVVALSEIALQDLHRIADALQILATKPAA